MLVLDAKKTELIIAPPRIIHPILFAIFPILFLLSHNIYNINSISVVFVPAVISLLSAIVLLFFFNLFTKNMRKAGIIVSIFLILFYSYGHVFVALWGKGACSGEICRNRYFIVLWGVIFTFASFMVMKLRRDFINSTKILNIISLILVIMSIVNIGIFKYKNVFSQHEIKEVNSETVHSILGERAQLNDIYYIVFDRYSSVEMLDKVFGYDNMEIVKHLQRKGFYVASQSSSNYMNTTTSLASSLNMEYLNSITEKAGKESQDLSPLHSMMQDYEVWRLLKAKGYKFIHMGSSFQPTKNNKYADLNINYGNLSEYDMILYRSTILFPILEKLGVYDPRFEHWERVLYKFQKLSELPHVNGPKFVFVHMLIPHTPYVFGREGNFLPQKLVDGRSRYENYVDQLVFLNEKIKVLVDQLITRSDVPPIIILQADEGSYPVRYVKEERDFDWTKASSLEIKQKMNILNAYYLPGVNTTELYQSISPVNSFRLILNLYFDPDFQLLPHQSYGYEKGYPYKFFEVTERLREH